MAYCDIISMERPPVTRGEFLDIERINVIVAQHIQIALTENV